MRPVDTKLPRSLNGAPPTGEVRCDCGSLLARRVGDRIELKCRRCKRVIGLAVLVATKEDCSCSAD